MDLEAQITIGADVAPGDYRIVAVSRDNGGSQWLANAGSETVYVALGVSDTSMTIQPMPLSEEEKNLVEYGTHTIDGITCHLYSRSGNPVANLLPLNETDYYEGDLYIPDYVVYQNMRFDVYQVENVWPAKGPFEDNDLITSISTSMNGIYIGGCDNLMKVELRRGCVTSPEIHDCPALEEIVFPWGCNTVYPIENCVNLKSLRLYTDVPMTVWTNWNGDSGLWSKESMPSLVDIYFTGDIPPAFSDPLKKLVPNEEVVIHVPAQTTETYRRGGWDGWNLVEDQQLQTINVKLDYTGNDFSNCCNTDQDSGNAGAKRSESADEGDGKAQLRVLMQNRSPRLVNNVTLGWSIDGVAQTPIQFETSLLTNHADEVVVDLPEDIAGRTHTIVANVVDIDGEPDEIEANSNVETEMTLPVLMPFPRKIVMEEATGTWCGWCPEGIITIEKMKERYPDNFIAIAVHNDKMGVADGSYATFEDMIDHYPSARVNRMRWQDLTPFDLDSGKDEAEAMIEATAAFTQEGRINVSTETTFGFSEKGNHAYNIAYVLVEDKVDPYSQTNFYSDPSAPEDPENYLDWWIHQGKQVEMLYDDVARGIYNYDGIEGLLPTVFSEGEAIASEYTVDLPSYVQDPANLRVVTLLIDTMNGEIMNAASTQISGPLPPSVERVEVNPTSSENHPGETLQLNAVVYPDNAFNKTLTWSSDNESVATVSQDGVVYVNAPGEAVITAAATDGSLVKSQALITGISGVDELFDGDTVWSLYDIDGRLLRGELSRGDMELLQPGVYILRNASRVIKIHIRH